jgi:hypothetical protein
MTLAAVAYGAECRKQYSMNFSAMADVVRRSGPPSAQVGSYNAKRQGSKGDKPKRELPNIF